LIFRCLGEISLSRGSEGLSLPPSKKTRALLAYLAVTGRPHRRERLCSLFWDIADDPRGALRWSLSKLRPLLDDPERRRIVADRESVAFDGAGVYLDLLEVKKQGALGVESASTDQLRRLAAEFHGEFLEGLEMSDFHEFQAWCVAEREHAQVLRARILGALVGRLSENPEEAIPFARTLVQVDPLNEPARAALVRLLGSQGRKLEAQQHYETGNRLFRELGSEPSGELLEAWRSVPRIPAPPAGQTAPATGEPLAVPVESETTVAGELGDGPATGKLIGRQSERSRLVGALDEAAGRRRSRIILVNGEPGVGKTRLLEEVMEAARERGGTVLDGCAYEAESGRPYGPWIDALRRLPPVKVGKTLGTDLAPLLPELAGDEAGERSKDKLFGAVVDLIASRAHSAPPVLLVFDDVHWCDEATVSLLHYVARMCRHRPLVMALAARGGELPDNVAMCRLVRSFRHDRVIEEFSLGPLSRDETTQLVREVAAGVDARRVFEQSAGNPLFALEVARSLPHRRDDLPQSLSDLVRDRIERLPPAATDLLRWGATLGRSFTVGRLSGLTSAQDEELVSALETLEKHALIREMRGSRELRGTYSFAHDLVRRVVYSDISAPRRRLMHRRIAKELGARGETDETVAAGIAHHASLAGEAGMATRACVSAGRRCLKLFANSEAYTLARKGMRYAEELAEPERVRLLLELSDIRFTARRPSRLEQAASRIEELAERALDLGSLEHARLGFHMLSYLRWEGGDWSDAQRQTMRAEMVSRSADEKEQLIAMAEAARCLALLERDMGQAGALLLEARALSGRLGVEPVAIPDGLGLLRLHEGRLDEAAGLFERARDLARRDRDRTDEFRSLEHRIMVELQRGRFDEARGLSEDLVVIGEKLREGSEAPFARVLTGLSRRAQGEEGALEDLEEALAALRIADAKHRLAYALTRAAEIELGRGEASVARVHASEALETARLLQRPSDVALAHAILARCASDLNDEKSSRRHIEALSREPLRGLSAHARREAKELLATDEGPRISRTGARPD
jgi:DNA-binding SARP family transcriptional activator